MVSLNRKVLWTSILVAHAWTGHAHALPLAAAPKSLERPVHTRPLQDPALPSGYSRSAEACADCHPDEAASWRKSRHAVAFTNPIFQASWLHWPNGWCLDCHLPLREAQVERLGTKAIAGSIHDVSEPPQAGLWNEGVTCSVCHVRDGAIVTANRPTREAQRAHPMQHDPDLSEPAFCASCHAFPFQNHTPAWPFSYGDTPAQDTIAEWSTSTAAREGKTCVTCHMGSSGHAFPGAHTPNMLRKTVKTEVTQRSDGRVQAKVWAPGAPHRIPTGDPFRRMELLLCDTPQCDVVHEKITMRRYFSRDDATWVPTRDTTLPPETPDAPSERLFERDLSVTIGGYMLRYRYGDVRFESALLPEDVGFVVTAGHVLKGDI